MEPLKMERKAADNKYLHRDVDRTLDLGLSYIAEHYGEAAVKEYVRQITETYFSPLIGAIQKDGLIALIDHINRTYEAEEASDVCHTHISDGTLFVHIDACPVLAYFRKTGHTVSPYYAETTKTFNKVLAERTGLAYCLNFYDDETGECEYMFSEKQDFPAVSRNEG